MLFWTIIKVAIKSLHANKLRTVLAMLEIVIGVGAVISMLAMGTGAQQQVMNRISAMGTKLLVIHPGQMGRRGVMSGTSQRLKIEEARAILDATQDVYQVASIVREMSQFKYYNKNTRSNVIGSTTTFFQILNFEIEKGRSFTEGEVRRMAKVAAIGPTTASNLFVLQDPVGETIKIKGINFQVIGITAGHRNGKNT